MQYNNSQIQAINHFKGPCMVLASAGTGKTAVITRRTQKLITDHGVNPSNILVITFTKAAATEMKQRFMQMMQEEHTRVTFGTFHAVFFMVLKVAYHFDASNIIPEEQRYQLMRQIVASHHLDYRDENEFIGNLLGEISKVKNNRIALDNYYSSQCGEAVFRQIYKEYDRYMKQNRRLDFDDMLLYTYELFDQRPDILQAWQNKYRYILIDEFQDINQLQFDIIRMLAQPQNNLFVVGDDDQSIYRFRGSKPEIMLKFPQEYPGCARILLDTNYRCDQNIVDGAMNLICHNKERFEKKIHAAKGAQEPIRYLSFKNQKEQNLFLIKSIEDVVKEGGSFSEFAVLFRTNTQPRLLIEQLMEYNIPVRMKDQIPNIYEHWIARDILTYIRIAAGSRKRADFLQIMNRPKRYIGRDSLCEPEVAFDEWIKMYDEQPWIADRIEHLEYDLKMIKTMNPFAAINYIRRGIGYEEYLREYAQYRNISPDDLIDILDELQESARGYKSYTEWIEHITTYTQEMKILAAKRQQAKDAVTLATFHSSKGLEFDQVFLIDVNEDVIPYKKAVLDKDIEEERRLFYVGMTRARKRLYVCSVASMRDEDMQASRFVEESKSGRKI
ncbi:MAG: ATP-dependent helicase [Agathobacter sp.]|nr:ATP-dependent helicase [Agathobacter sp.]